MGLFIPRELARRSQQSRKDRGLVKEKDLVTIKVAMPTLNVPEYETMQLLFGLARNNVYRIDGSDKTFQIVLDLCHGSIIHHARNEMVDPRLSTKEDNTWWDYVIFIDSDMTWKQNWIIEMALHDLPVVGGLCVRKTRPYKPTVFKYQESTGIFTSPILGPKLFDGTRPKEQRLLEVDGVGTGFTMIRRDVIESLAPPWFWFTLEPLKDDPTKKQAFGEDAFFCKICREQGIKMYVDLEVTPGHIGKYEYTISDYLQAMSEDAVAMADYKGIGDEQSLQDALKGLRGVNDDNGSNGRGAEVAVEAGTAV